jgi:hypothetical protein
MKLCSRTKNIAEKIKTLMVKKGTLDIIVYLFMCGNVENVFFVGK